MRTSDKSSLVSTYFIPLLAENADFHTTDLHNGFHSIDFSSERSLVSTTYYLQGGTCILGEMLVDYVHDPIGYRFFCE